MTDTERGSIAKFTPGPWAANLDSGFITRKGQEYHYPPIVGAGDHWRDGPYITITNPADESLILAAPEMYAALKSLHDEMDEYQRINNLSAYNNHVMRQARAALAKATNSADRSPADALSG